MVVLAAWLSRHHGNRHRAVSLSSLSQRNRHPRQTRLRSLRVGRQRDGESDPSTRYRAAMRMVGQRTRLACRLRCLAATIFSCACITESDDILRKVRDCEDALANTRDACATQPTAMAREV